MAQQADEIALTDFGSIQEREKSKSMEATMPQYDCFLSECIKLALTGTELKHFPLYFAEKASGDEMESIIKR